MIGSWTSNSREKTMKNKVIAVIGANYGDEGKGLAVDHICRGLSNPLVVRYNGGAQAGHTVQTSDGKHHVFSHFGSGTIAGAKTYFTEDFIINPVLFWREHEELEAMGVKTLAKIYASAQCLITTPFDMMLNQILETSRGKARHGSCGRGIFETVLRNRKLKYGLKLWQIDSTYKREGLREFGRKIVKEYMPERLAEIGLDESHMPSEETIDIAMSLFVEDTMDFFHTVTKVHTDRTIITNYDVVFEGAQGLCLDENYGIFPYVTPSRTGMTNVSKIAARNNISNVEAHYVTRTYLTRHGNGPLRNETTDLKLCDPTNVTNQWQGEFRYGILSPRIMASLINHDVGLNNGFVNVKPYLFVTHADQPAPIIINGMTREPNDSLEMRVRDIYKTAGIPVSYASAGPTSRHVVPLWSE